MLAGLFNILIGAFSFIIVLGFVVFFHELGHYSVARFFKVAVEKFSIGFGKPIVQWKAKSGTLWSISRIPLGGYVKFVGDAGAASNPDTEQLKQLKQEISEQDGDEAWRSCLHFKPLYQRALVVAAGPIANFLLAAIMFAGLAFVYGSYVLKAEIVSIEKDSPAQQAGLLAGDQFLKINGKKAVLYNQVVNAILLNSDTQMDVLIERDGAQQQLKLTPVRRSKRDGVGGRYTGGHIGVQFSSENVEHRKYSLGQASAKGVGDVYRSLANTGVYIKRIFQGKEDGKALGSVGKIAAISGKMGAQAAGVDGTLSHKLNIWLKSMIALAASLSVALGFANLLPIPVLDGGHLLFYGYEAVMRKPLSERSQEIGYKAGFALLITLFLVLTWNDIGYVADMFSHNG